MGGRKHDVDRSLRFAVPSSRQTATLKIAGAKLQARLVEMSARDFTVLVGAPLPDVRINDVGELRSAEGRFEVSVTNVAEVGPDEMTSQRQASMLRLSLYRRRELSAPGNGLGRLKPWRGRRWRKIYLSPAVKRTIGTLVVLTIVLLPILVVVGAASPEQSVLRAMCDWGRHTISPTDNRDGSPQATVATTDVSQNTAAARAVLSLPGPEPFASPQVVQALELTAEQQSKLNAMIEATVAALRECDKRWQGESRHTNSKKRAIVMDAARQEALKILTEPQREKWLEMELTK